jgi:hypothetical protein
MIIDLDALKVTNESLYLAVSRTLGFRHGEHSVSPHDFLPAVSRRLQDWFTAQQAKSVPKPVVKVPSSAPIAQAPPQPPAPEPETTVVDRPVPPQEQAPEPFLSEEELLQRATDQARGFSRLQQFVDEQGLEDTPETASLVEVWLTERHLFWSAANVDKAVLSLQKVLRWKPKVPPAPEPTEVLQDWQLPLDASEAQLKKSDPKALKDYLSRIHKQRPYVRSSGSFGSKF